MAKAGGNLQTAETNWAEKAAAGAQLWHGDEGAYCRGLAQYGVDVAACNAVMGARYNQGIARAAQNNAFLNGVQAAAAQNKWSTRWLQKMNGRGGALAVR